MKVVKPAKLPVLTRVVEFERVPHLHVAALVAFPFDEPRGILEEIAFWPIAMAELGEAAVLDEGFAKVRGELLLCGSYHAPAGETVRASYVRVSAGPVDKRLSVIGDRYWKDGVPTEPEPLTSLPVDWAHAFGGEGYEANPLGKGLSPVSLDGVVLHPLPNVETYERLVRSPSQKPSPAGFMPMDVTFQQRRRRAGSYNRLWFEQHFPGMPPDMDPAFFNAAAEDQWIDGFWTGDESFSIENMHPDKPRIEGKLPGLTTRCFVSRRGAEPTALHEVTMRCDTVWLFPQPELGVLVFHGAIPIGEDDAGDVGHLVAACEEPVHPRSLDHYQRALARRLDKDKGALVGLSDSDLMPSREAGVAPNFGELDVGCWVRSEQLQERNLRRGTERRIARARMEVEEQGLDPADFGLLEPISPELEPPLDDLDAVASFAEAQTRRADDEIKKLDALKEDAEQRAREAYEDVGQDYEAALAEAARAGAGPPRFSAAEHIQLMLDNLETAREGGVPLEELEAQMADPDYQAELIRTEHELREMYRQYGHFQPAAAAMDKAASARAQVVVQAAFDSKTSLAGRDLTGADLSGMDLVGLDLTGAYLEGANLEDCDLTGARLENAVLARANLKDASFAAAVLGGANLGGAVLGGAIFDQADLTDAVLSRAELAGAKLTGAKLAGVDLLETKFGNVDLSGAALPKATIIQADLTGARLVGADLSEATFIECTLDGADFSRALLHKTTFVACHGQAVSFRLADFRQGVVVHGSELPEADFTDAKLDQANLRGTALMAARLDGAHMSGADLSECDVTGGSLDRAVATGAMLIRTKLDGASLREINLMDALMSKSTVAGADLTGANLFRADLSRVRGDGETRFTDALVTHVRYLPKADAPPEGLP